MRVISGTARGTVLFAPKGLNTRPTSDRMKEDLFNILGATVYGAGILDLFAGSGALGIEALSRGAQSAVFVDMETDGLIRKNLEKTRLVSGVVLRMDCLNFLKTTDDKGFHIILMDPPYNKGLANAAVSIIFERKLLAPGGILCSETAHGEEIETPYSLIKNKRYKLARLLFYKNDKG